MIEDIVCFGKGVVVGGGVDRVAVAGRRENKEMKKKGIQLCNEDVHLFVGALTHVNYSFVLPPLFTVFVCVCCVFGCVLCS